MPSSKDEPKEVQLKYVTFCHPASLYHSKWTESCTMAYANKEMQNMNIEKAVIIVASSFIITSVILASVHSINWLWFTGFVGVNLLQSAFTGFCPLAKILRALGLETGTLYG